MDKITNELHYGKEVWTNTVTDKIRREECLCLCCEKMKYDKKSNCPIAQSLYEICCNNNVAFMLTRCKSFIRKSGDNSCQ